MEGSICFEYRWGLKPVLIYVLCHTKPIFDFDYHNKRSKTPNNMSSRKRSNTYWSTNTFVCPVGSNMYCPNNMSSVKRSNMYWSINVSLLKRSNMYWHINMSSLKSSNMYWSTNNMSSRIGSNMHWLHQYATKFNMMYNAYWDSYRIIQGMVSSMTGLGCAVMLNLQFTIHPSLVLSLGSIHRSTRKETPVIRGAGLDSCGKWVYHLWSFRFGV